MRIADFQEFKSLSEITRTFPSEEFCIQALEKIRWADDIVSPFDKASKVYSCAGSRYRCRNTGKYFNVKTHTIFHNTKIELIKWFQAIWLVTHSEKMTAFELAKKIDVTPKTAWLMQKRISKYVKTKATKSEKTSELPLTDWLNQLK